MADDPSANPGAGGQDAPLSQEDIDAALNAGGGSEAAEPAPAADEAGLVSQADIDALMAGGEAEAAPAAEPDQRVDSCGRPFDEAAAAMAAAIEEEKAAAPAEPAGEPVDLADFGADGADGGLSHDIDLLHDVELRVKIELGRTSMLVEDVLKLDEGSVVELDKLAGDPVDVFANDRLIARGEVLVLNDNFCVRVGEIFSGQAAET